MKQLILALLLMGTSCAATISAPEEAPRCNTLSRVSTTKELGDSSSVVIFAFGCDYQSDGDGNLAFVPLANAKEVNIAVIETLIEMVDGQPVTKQKPSQITIKVVGSSVTPIPDDPDDPDDGNEPPISGEFREEAIKAFGKVGANYRGFAPDVAKAYRRVAAEQSITELVELRAALIVFNRTAIPTGAPRQAWMPFFEHLESIDKLGVDTTEEFRSMCQDVAAGLDTAIASSRTIQPRLAELDTKKSIKVNPRVQRPNGTWRHATTCELNGTCTPPDGVLTWEEFN